MKMQKRLILLLLVTMAVSLTMGCIAEPQETQAPTQITTEPTELTTEPQTDPPTDPPTEPPTEVLTEEPTQAATESVDEELLAAYQSLFDWSGEIMFPRATGYEYTRPEDVDLYYLFYNGVDYPGSWDSIAESEEALLVREGFWREMDIQILPAYLLEEKLQQYFGVGLDDVQIPDEWVYSAETDTYYSNHNDAYVHVAEVTGYTELANGNVVLHLIVDYAHKGEEYYSDAAMDMELHPTKDVWQIVSNVFAE